MDAAESASDILDSVDSGINQVTVFNIFWIVSILLPEISSDRHTLSVLLLSAVGLCHEQDGGLCELVIVLALELGPVGELDAHILEFNLGIVQKHADVLCATVEIKVM